ncbi:hypothetical protein [Marinobacterium sp. BA1]|uniref:hypothetical protein n=1 Tax=Marinobacterium sp. BA1 TaxID=3138931 RepID=UPI0034E8C1A9
MNEDVKATREELMERVDQMKAKEKRFFFRSSHCHTVWRDSLSRVDGLTGNHYRRKR